MFKPISDEYAEAFAQIVTDLSPHQVCSKCHEMKPCSAFGKLTKSKNGLNPQCKPCISQRNIDFRAKHKEENPDEDVTAFECMKCHEIKPRSDFHKDSSTTRGVDYKCKPCKLEWHKQYYEDNKNSISQNTC